MLIIPKSMKKHTTNHLCINYTTETTDRSSLIITKNVIRRREKWGFDSPSFSSFISVCGKLTCIRSICVSMVQQAYGICCFSIRKKQEQTAEYTENNYVVSKQSWNWSKINQWLYLINNRSRLILFSNDEESVSRVPRTKHASQVSVAPLLFWKQQTLISFFTFEFKYYSLFS